MPSSSPYPLPLSPLPRDSDDTRLASLLGRLHQSIRPSLSSSLCKSLGDYSFSHALYQQSLLYYQWEVHYHCLALALAANDADAQARITALRRVGECYAELMEYDSAVAHYETALTFLHDPHADFDRLTRSVHSASLVQIAPSSNHWRLCQELCLLLGNALLEWSDDSTDRYQFNLIKTYRAYWYYKHSVALARSLGVGDGTGSSSGNRNLTKELSLILIRSMQNLGNVYVQLLYFINSELQYRRRLRGQAVAGTNADNDSNEMALVSTTSEVSTGSRTSEMDTNGGFGSEYDHPMDTLDPSDTYSAAVADRTAPAPTSNSTCNDGECANDSFRTLDGDYSLRLLAQSESELHSLQSHYRQRAAQLFDDSLAKVITEFHSDTALLILIYFNSASLYEKVSEWDSAVHRAHQAIAASQKSRLNAATKLEHELSSRSQLVTLLCRAQRFAHALTQAEDAYQLACQSGNAQQRQRAENDRVIARDSLKRDEEIEAAQRRIDTLTGSDITSSASDCTTLVRAYHSLIALYHANIEEGLLPVESFTAAFEQHSELLALLEHRANTASVETGSAALMHCLMTTYLYCAYTHYQYLHHLLRTNNHQRELQSILARARTLCHSAHSLAKLGEDRAIAVISLTLQSKLLYVSGEDSSECLRVMEQAWRESQSIPHSVLLERYCLENILRVYDANDSSDSDDDSDTESMTTDDCVLPCAWRRKEREFRSHLSSVIRRSEAPAYVKHAHREADYLRHQCWRIEVAQEW